MEPKTVMNNCLQNRIGGPICPGLIYASSATFPPEDMLLDIVRVAERENAAHGLSGMLCYSASRYVQLLQGPPDGLDRLWDNLRRDIRHRILWMARLPDRLRTIPAHLPMGYASEAQIREVDAGLRLDALGTRPADGADRLSAALGGLAAAIYPGLCEDRIAV